MENIATMYNAIPSEAMQGGNYAALAVVMAILLGAILFKKHKK